MTRRTITGAAAALAAAVLVSLSACSLVVPKGDFNVTVAVKNAQHPAYGTGSNLGYVVNDVQGATLTLARGTTYTFGINAPGHPFYLTTDPTGGPSGLASEWTSGVTGNETEIGLMTFVVGQDAPALLYYQCSVHDSMGWKIVITG